MRAYISIDMEGIAGVAARATVRPGTADYEKGRVWMTREANAAIEGAFAGGATEVVVNDAHGPMVNLLPDQLDRRARLLTGDPKKYSMVAGIDTGVEAAMFIGYHGRAGQGQAVLAHTYSSDDVYDVRINGSPASETRINAYLAGAYQVPVVLVSGDDTTCREAEELLPGCHSVPVKEGLAVNAALSLHPDEACARLQSAAKAAVEATPTKPLIPPAPYELEVDLLTLQMAEVATLLPGTERIAGRTVRHVTDDFRTSFQVLQAWLYLAAASRLTSAARG